MANDPRPPPGFGCLSTIIGAVVLAAVVVLFFFVGLVALVVVAGILVLGLIVWAVDRVLLAVSPARRERRAGQSGVFVWPSGQFGTGQVIDTTATESPTSGDQPRLDDPHPDGPGPG
jgi:hypothetical protein